MAENTDGTASKRIPLTATAWNEIRDFCRGMDVTYSEAIEFLLHDVMKPGEDALTAGRRLAQQRDKKP